MAGVCSAGRLAAAARASATEEAVLALEAAEAVEGAALVVVAEGMTAGWVVGREVAARRSRYNPSQTHTLIQRRPSPRPGRLGRRPCRRY